jgi:toxin YoeB
MVKWDIVFTPQAAKDAKKITAANLKSKVQILFDVLAVNPFQNPPSYEKLKGDLHEFYSRRINRQHRLVYQIYQKEKTIKIIRLWTHYE